VHAKIYANWNDLGLVIDGHVEDGHVIPSPVDTLIRLGIDDVGNIFDQLLEVGETDAEHITVNIKDQSYTFNREMASELIGVVSSVWTEYEIGAAADKVVPDEWVEAYVQTISS